METYTKDVRFEKDSVEPYHVWLDKEVEFQKLARNIYPFVPEILSTNETNIIMERVKGTTVKQYLIQGRNFKKYDDIIFRIKFALRQFHKHGMIHGDTNLENYIIDGDHVWIIDFGLAKRTRDRKVQKREMNKLERNVIFLIAMILSDMYSYNATKKDALWFKQKFGIEPDKYITYR